MKRTKPEALPAQLHNACGFLEHWHLEHTHDKITRLAGDYADILIVSDPVWRERLERFVSSVFESPDPFVLKLREVHAMFGKLIETNEVDGTSTPQLKHLMRTVLQQMLATLPPDEDFTDPAPPASGGVQ